MIGDTSLSNLMEESHYLVKEEGFTYKDIHEMPVFEFDTHVDIMLARLKKEASDAEMAKNKNNL